MSQAATRILIIFLAGMLLVLLTGWLLTINLEHGATSSVPNKNPSALRNIATWGGSLTYGYGTPNPPTTSYPSDLKADFNDGREVFNGGVPGDTSAETFARFITRPDLWGYTTVIWTGRNDMVGINDTGNGRREDFATTTTDAHIAEMVQDLQSVGNNNYLVLSILNAPDETVGTNKYGTIVTYNAHLASIYGSHYFDVRSFLTALATTTADKANGVIPLMYEYRPNGVHLNPLGYSIVAKKIQQLLVTDFGI